MEAPGGAIPPKMFGKLRMEFWMDFARCFLKSGVVPKAENGSKIFSFSFFGFFFFFFSFI